MPRSYTKHRSANLAAGLRRSRTGGGGRGATLATPQAIVAKAAVCVLLISVPLFLVYEVSLMQGMLGKVEFITRGSMRRLKRVGSFDSEPRLLSNAGTRPNTASCPSQFDTDGEGNEVQRATLVIQTSVDRLWIIGETCTRWATDPIVVVVSIRTSDYDRTGAKGSGPYTSPKVDSILDDFASDCPHVTVIEYFLDSTQSLPQNDPLNHLRNVGLDAVTTTHALVLDVDLVPSKDLDLKVRDALLLREENKRSNRRNGKIEDDMDAISLPVFQRFLGKNMGGITIDYCRNTTRFDCVGLLKQNSSFIPQTFDAMKHCINETRCSVVYKVVNYYGHSSTDYESWLEKIWYTDEDEAATGGKTEVSDASGKNGKKVVRDIRPIPCFDAVDHYEPYLIMRWCPRTGHPGASQRRPIPPYFDERFTGYGEDKISWLHHLRKRGYRFYILPEGFAVHHPHPWSGASVTWGKEADGLRLEMQKRLKQYTQELKDMYKDSSREVVGQCAKIRPLPPWKPPVDYNGVTEAPDR